MNLKFLITSFLLAAGVAQAQNQPAQLPDDLRALVQQANANFPTLKQQQQQIQANELRIDIARTAMRPNVNGNASYQYLTPVAQATLPVDGVNRNIQFQPNHNVNASVGVGQTIYDWGRTNAAVQQATGNVQILRRSQEITQQAVAYQVAAAYYGIGFLQRSLTVQDSVIRTAGANVQLLVTRLQNGDALQYDVLTQQVRVKAAQNRKIEIQNQLERQLATLTYLTGNANPDISRAIAQFDLEAAGNTVTTQPYTLANDAQSVAVGNKDVLLAQDRVRQAQTEILATKLSGRPNLSFCRFGWFP